LFNFFLGAGGRRNCSFTTSDRRKQWLKNNERENTEGRAKEREKYATIEYKRHIPIQLKYQGLFLYLPSKHLEKRRRRLCLRCSRKGKKTVFAVGFFIDE